MIDIDWDNFRKVPGPIVIEKKDIIDTSHFTRIQNAQEEEKLDPFAFYKENNESTPKVMKIISRLIKFLKAKFRSFCFDSL